jgi:23S rRNA C2498 (ribose-2'-O)-methylase RlmM
MEKELALTKEQSTDVMKVLIERFQELEKQGAGLPLETANRKALQKLSNILNDQQYALYQELRTKSKQQKDQYLKQHPGFAFSKEDMEMDF